jgi:hypothetical protein
MKNDIRMTTKWYDDPETLMARREAAGSWAALFRESGVPVTTLKDAASRHGSKSVTRTVSNFDLDELVETYAEVLSVVVVRDTREHYLDEEGLLFLLPAHWTNKQKEMFHELHFWHMKETMKDGLMAFLAEVGLAEKVPVERVA